MNAEKLFFSNTYRRVRRIKAMNENLASELKEYGVMNEVIRNIFRKDFDIA